VTKLLCSSAFLVSYQSSRADTSLLEETHQRLITTDH
jgi:hypothetical protein